MKSVMRLAVVEAHNVVTVRDGSFVLDHRSVPLDDTQSSRFFQP